ncbi:hypothetical protein PF005_g31316 [Phytophthora fragariae]|uniref:Secreted protein n=1 Tax=Phytophthora fragariae TaxID=53985 RepID=A0A6A3V5I5_9STRA|nr:hypothetical protein PF005_g31316 [Phytophthora fragariae]
MLYISLICVLLVYGIQLLESPTRLAGDVAGGHGRGDAHHRACNRGGASSTLWHHAGRLDPRVRALPRCVRLLRSGHSSEDGTAQYDPAAQRRGRRPDSTGPP